MNKVLKIAAVVLVAILIIVVVSKTFTGSHLGMDTGSNYAVSPGYANPLSVGSTGVSNFRQTEKMGMPSDAVFIEQSVPSPDMAPADKKVIKNGNLSLKVDNADEALEKISTVARENGGEIFSSNFYQSSDNVKSGTVTVKVPVANFEQAYGEIKKVASLVIRDATAGQDVTEQYVDLKAQLTNAQAEEQTFVRILDRAQDIEDVLAVTRELSRVRGTVEQLEARIKFLESQTDMATISVELTENQNITAVDSWRPVQVVKESVNALLEGLQGFADFIIRFLITVLPLLALWGIIIWGLYLIGRKIYLRMKARNQNL